MPTKGAAVHVVPMLSPVLEDFVPPQFRGNVPDTPRSAGEQVIAPAPTVLQELQAKRKEAALAAEAPSTGSEEDSEKETTAGIRSRLALTLLQWRRRAQRGLVQVTSKKPVQVQGLRRHKSSKKTRQYLNPLCLLARLRDTYIHMMNTVATSGVVPGGAPMGDDSGTQGSTLFFSREFDSESIARLVELERGNSLKSDPSKPPVLSRSKSSRGVLDVSASYFSFSNGASKSGRRVSGEGLSRSKSNSLSDEVFFSQSKHRSRSGKKMHVNPYADSNWSADRSVAAKRETMSGPLEFHFQHQMRTSSGTEIRTRDDSLFAYRQ